jgi:chemotaxis-related protein WspB
MLMLLFYVGNDLYALDSSQVVEIIPKVLLRKIHHAPEYIAGLFNYRGSIVPVIDLCHLIQGNPSRSHLSTRIIMVNYVGRDQNKHYLGLMAEKITETLNKPDTELVDSGIQMDEAPYLGEMIMDEKGMIQCIRLESLLSEQQQLYLLPGKDNKQLIIQENVTSYD